MSTVRPLPHDSGHAARSVSCPRCHGELDRVSRHVADRLLSLVVPVHRYRCPRFGCQWEGVRRPPRSPGPPAG